MNTEFEMTPFFEMTPDLVCIADKEGYFKKVNLSVIKKLEYSQEELFSKPIESFIHPDDKEITRLKRQELINGNALINFQNRYITKKNKIIWLDWTSIYFPENEVVFAIAKDVTERKQTEKEIEEKYVKFKSLASHFKTKVEKDKKYLAMELHEELAQLASTIKMDLDLISKDSNLSTLSKNRIDHALSASQQLINAIRRISYTISPGMLEDLGLIDTLQWHCQEFSFLNGIPCKFEVKCNTNQLDPEVQVDLFRICQEALSNIMYHAQASKVTVTLECINDLVCLSIIDDGKGFELSNILYSSGLTSMKERAESINGKLVINSQPGAGTKIHFTIPQ